MPTQITRSEVLDLIATGAQLVDVLPEAEFTHEHLPGAINIPLRPLDTRVPADLDPASSVIAYCWGP